MILVVDRDIKFSKLVGATLKEMNPGQQFECCIGDRNDWKLYNDPAITHIVVGQPTEVHTDTGQVDNYDAPVIEMLESLRLGAIWRKNFSNNNSPEHILFKPRSKFELPILVIRRQGDDSVPREFTEYLKSRPKFIEKFYKTCGANEIVHWPGDDQGLKDAFNTIIQHRS